MPDQNESLKEFVARLEASKVLLSELEKTIIDAEAKHFLLEPSKAQLKDVKRNLDGAHQLESAAGFGLVGAEIELERIKKLLARCGPNLKFNG
jgi:hypothetical protein